MIKESICFMLILILVTSCGAYYSHGVANSSTQFGDEMSINSVIGM